MADKRKRAAPTIDLTATEVPPKAAESNAASAPDAPPPESPAESTSSPSGGAQAAPEPSSTRADDARPRAAGPGIFAPAVAAGLASAALVTAIFAALWFTGVLPERNASSDDGRLAALQKQTDAQITALKKQVSDLQDKPPPAPDTQAIDALGRRITKLENHIATLPPGDKTVAERLASADNAVKSLGIAVTALNKRGDDVAARVAQAEQHAAAADKAVSELRDSVQTAKREAAGAVDTAALDALQQRVASVEQAVKAARAQVEQVSANDKAARLALSAATLRETAQSGAPYANELAQAKALGGDANGLAVLDRFAKSGVPSKAALARELQALIPALMKSAGTQKTPDGFFARLQANAGSLVRISPVDAPEGDMPADVLARIEVDAAHEDIAAALADLEKLPASARAPAQDWIEKAKARQAALAAARKFAADASRSLGAR
jgi:hypothetical protein